MISQGRILAVDYGKTNIGLACSDELRLTVQPLTSLPNLGKKDFLQQIRDLTEKLDIRELVLGMPLRMDGSRGDAAEAMEKISRSLSGTLQLPVLETDERLSTVEAMEIWRGMSPKQKKRYRTVDSLAAALILERHMKENATS